MSTPAENVSATVTLTDEERANLSDEDRIAELLISEDESASEDEREDENLTAASNQDEDEESDDESEAADGDDDEEGEETTSEAAADEDVTWEGVIGLSEDQLSFDDDGNLKGIHVKVNDFEGTLTIPELVAGFQTNKAVTMKGQQQAEEYKQFESQKEQVQQVYAAKLESVDLLTQHFEKQLISAYDGVDWDKLRNEDPAEYAAARSDFATKAQELQQIKEAIAKDQETARGEALEAQQAQAKEYIQKQAELMVQNNPEWADKKVLETAYADFKTFVNDTYGFSEQEFDSVFDARLIELIKDAKRYHEGVKVANKKRGKPVPKFQKSSGKKPMPKATKLDKLTKAAKNAQGQQKRDLQTSAVAELLMGN